MSGPVTINVQRYDYAQEAVPFAARGPAGLYVGEPVRIRRPTAGVLWLLRVTSYAGDPWDAGLQLKLQTRVHDAWFSVALSNGFGDGYMGKEVLYKLSATEPVDGIDQSGALTGGDDFGDGMVGGNVRHFLGDEWRVVWQMTGENPLTAFTFGSWLCPVG